MVGEPVCHSADALVQQRLGRSGSHDLRQGVHQLLAQALLQWGQVPKDAHQLDGHPVVGGRLRTNGTSRGDGIGVSDEEDESVFLMAQASNEKRRGEGRGGGGGSPVEELILGCVGSSQDPRVV